MRIEYIDIDGKQVPDKLVFDEGETIEPLVNRGEEIGMFINDLAAGYEIRLEHLLAHPPVMAQVVDIYARNITALSAYCENAVLRLNRAYAEYFK
jgi:hypothetical protein